MRRGAGLGLVLLLCGVIYLLAQAGILHISSALWSGRVLWPLVLVVIGGFGLCEFRRGRVPWASLYFVVLGLTLAVKGSGMVPWMNHVTGWDFTWALLLIFAGLHLLTPRRRRGFGDPSVIAVISNEKRGGGGRSKASGRLRHMHRDEGRGDWRLVGDVSIGQEPWVLKDMELWHWVGDIRINVRRETGLGDSPGRHPHGSADAWEERD